MDETLKPCPAECLHTVDRGGPSLFRRRGDIFGVYCQTCQCSTEYYSTEAEAITAWNTPADFRTARKSLGLTQHGLAGVLRMGKWGFQSVAKWEKGEVPIPGPVQVAMELMVREADRALWVEVERLRMGKVSPAQTQPQE